MRAGVMQQAQEAKSPQGLTAVGAGGGDEVKRQRKVTLTDTSRLVATYRRVGTRTAAQGPEKAAGTAARRATVESRDGT